MEALSTIRQSALEGDAVQLCFVNIEGHWSRASTLPLSITLCQLGTDTITPLHLLIVIHLGHLSRIRCRHTYIQGL